MICLTIRVPNSRKCKAFGHFEWGPPIMALRAAMSTCLSLSMSLSLILDQASLLYMMPLCSLASRNLRPTSIRQSLGISARMPVISATLPQPLFLLSSRHGRSDPDDDITSPRYLTDSAVLITLSWTFDLGQIFWHFFLPI